MTDPQTGYFAVSTAPQVLQAYKVVHNGGAGTNVAVGKVLKAK
jgi:hypothetical protein